MGFPIQFSSYAVILFSAAPSAISNATTYLLNTDKPRPQKVHTVPTMADRMVAQ